MSERQYDTRCSDLGVDALELIFQLLDDLVPRIRRPARDEPELTRGQVQHDLLASARDGVSLDLAVDALNLGALAAAGVPRTAEDLHGVGSAKFGDSRGRKL